MIYKAHYSIIILSNGPYISLYEHLKMMIWNDAPVLGDSELHGPYRNGRQQKPLGAALAESSPSVQAHAVLPSRKTAGLGPLKLMDRD